MIHHGKLCDKSLVAAVFNFTTVVRIQEPHSVVNNKHCPRVTHCRIKCDCHLPFQGDCSKGAKALSLKTPSYHTIYSTVCLDG